MFILCKHAAILMDTNVLSGPPPAPASGGSGEEGGGRMWEAFRPLCSFQSVNFAQLFPVSPSLPIFPSSFTWGLLMHVITKLAAVGGCRGVHTPPKNAPPVPSSPPPLHLHFYCHRSTAVLLSHRCNHYAIIPFPVQSVCDITNDLSSPLSCIVTDWLCSGKTLW